MNIRIFWPDYVYCFFVLKQWCNKLTFLIQDTITNDDLFESKVQEYNLKLMLDAEEASLTELKAQHEEVKLLSTSVVWWWIVTITGPCNFKTNDI